MSEVYTYNFKILCYYVNKAIPSLWECGVEEKILVKSAIFNAVIIFVWHIYSSCFFVSARLAHEWQAFVSRTHKLRKNFVSVKGIYYQVPIREFVMVVNLNCMCYGFIMLSVQAEVEGQTITWMTPHPLQQVVPDDVDITTMLNFLQFYEVSFTSFVASFLASFFCPHWYLLLHS